MNPFKNGAENSPPIGQTRAALYANLQPSQAQQCTREWLQTANRWGDVTSAKRAGVDVLAVPLFCRFSHVYIIQMEAVNLRFCPQTAVSSRRYWVSSWLLAALCIRCLAAKLKMVHVLSMRTRQTDKSSRTLRCVDVNPIKIYIGELWRGSLVRRSDAVRVVHRDQDGLVCFSEHCDVPEMNITDVATPASLRFEMNQWTLRVRCVAWPHHYILKCNIPHSTALLAACGHRTVCSDPYSQKGFQ